MPFNFINLTKHAVYKCLNSFKDYIHDSLINMKGMGKWKLWVKPWYQFNSSFLLYLYYKRIDMGLLIFRHFHRAAANGDLEMAKLLISIGANVNAKDVCFTEQFITNRTFQ